MLLPILHAPRRARRRVGHEEDVSCHVLTNFRILPFLCAGNSINKGLLGCSSRLFRYVPIVTMESHHAYHNHTADTHTVFSPVVPTVLIPVAALLAIAFGSWLWYRVSAIKVGNGSHGLRTENGREYLLEEEQRGEDEVH